MKVNFATMNLQSKDPQRSKRFYVDAIGLLEDLRRSEPPSFFYLRSGGADITIGLLRTGASAEPSDTMELGFEVDDIPAVKERLSTLGMYEYRQESMGWGDTLELRDPDGYRCTIYSLRKREG